MLRFRAPKFRSKPGRVAAAGLGKKQVMKNRPFERSGLSSLHQPLLCLADQLDELGIGKLVRLEAIGHRRRIDRE